MTWISTIEAAYVLEITEMAVRKQAYSGVIDYQYVGGKGRSGKRSRFHLKVSHQPLRCAIK